MTTDMSLDPRITLHQGEKMIQDHSGIQVYSSVERISDQFKGLLFDAYGVFWGGNHVGLLPGCKETMEKLVAIGKCVGILSNSTQLSKKEVEKLKGHELIEGKHFHFLITSGEVAKKMFLHQELPFPTPRKAFYLFGTIHPKFSSHQAIFEGSLFQQTSHLAEADFIYISIPHIDGKDQTDPLLFKEQLNEMGEMKLPMICVNPDRFAHEGNPPRAVVRQGSIAMMYEERGGQVFYVGKPSEIMYSAAMQHFMLHGIDRRQDIVMVGDTPETDIRGANNFGIPSALVIKTGIMADRIERHGWQGILRTLSTQDFPNLFLERMASHDSVLLDKKIADVYS